MDKDATIATLTMLVRKLRSAGTKHSYSLHDGIAICKFCGSKFHYSAFDCFDEAEFHKVDCDYIISGVILDGLEEAK